MTRQFSARPLAITAAAAAIVATTQLVVRPSVHTEGFVRCRRVSFMENKKKKHLPARIKTRVASAFYCVSDVVRSLVKMPYNLWPQTISIFKPRNDSVPDPNTVVYIQSDYTEFVFHVREELNTLLIHLHCVNIARARLHIR
jgi:hypothetical protein